LTFPPDFYVRLRTVTIETTYAFGPDFVVNGSNHVASISDGQHA
jgi:hypothetical protein